MEKFWGKILGKIRLYERHEVRKGKEHDQLRAILNNILLIA